MYNIVMKRNLAGGIILLAIISLVIGGLHMNSFALSTPEIKVTRSLAGFGNVLVFEGAQGQLLTVNSLSDIGRTEGDEAFFNVDNSSPNYMAVEIERDSLKNETHTFDINSVKGTVEQNQAYVNFLMEGNMNVMLEGYEDYGGNVFGHATRATVEIL
jgi:hypothetical protein